MAERAEPFPGARPCTAGRTAPRYRHLPGVRLSPRPPLRGRDAGDRVQISVLPLSFPLWTIIDEIGQQWTVTVKRKADAGDFRLYPGRSGRAAGRPLRDGRSLGSH